jgi:hypothetical protein
MAIGAVTASMIDADIMMAYAEEINMHKAYVRWVAGLHHCRGISGSRQAQPLFAFCSSFAIRSLR